MEDAWGEDRLMAKLSVNQCIGLWATDKTHVYSVKTTGQGLDAPGAYCKRIVQYAGGQTVDHVYATRCLTNFSMRPIWDQIMATESVRVAQLIYILGQLRVPQRCIKSVKTDCVVVQGLEPGRRRRVLGIADTCFKDLANLRRKYEKPGKNQMQLDDAYAMASREDDEDPVFRYGEGSVLQGFYKEPVMDAREPEPVMAWRDLNEADALAAATEEGLLVLGPPGTGKTHWVRSLVQRLREQGKRVDVIAKTHAACQNFGCDAQTADHWVRRHVRAGGLHCDYLVVDELSQMNAALWCDLSVASMKGVKLIMSGDWGQFGAIMDSYAGVPVPRDALECSDMLRQLVGSNRFRLTVNRRSDPAIFNYITSLRPGEEGERDYDDALAEARRLFPRTNQPANWTLTISHRRRVAVNAWRNEALKPEGAVRFAYERVGKAVANEPQSMWLWPGLTLIGAGAKVTKGVLCTVAAVSESEVQLSTGVKLTAEQVVRQTRLAHALTYASVQGLTLPGRVRLECDSPNVRLRHLYVGCSRATRHDLLEVA